MTDDDIANRFIDRTAEQELFEELLQLAGGERVLVITDVGDRGKSTLLQRLKYICEWKNAPALPVSLIPLDQVTPADPYELVRQIRRDLPLPFPEFDRLSDGLLAKEPNLFLGATSSVAGAVDARQTTVTGGVVAGAYVFAPNATAVTIERREWTPQIEERARERTIDAFCRELRAICTTQLVVLILDSVDERANGTLREWTQRRIVRELCFDDETHAEKLLLVVAGRQRPPFATARYQARFKSIDALGLWQEEHLRAFLALNGIHDLSQEDFEFVYNKLKQGLGLSRALQLASLIAKG
ncbi:MAG TPA: hypothetical protein VHV78_01890 [Gemmatimonadaceae bacterium]|nr:hypothetical protein [Gemmatimonadaceae bacterium]